MHNKIKNRVFALFMCILLLSNFIFVNLVYAGADKPEGDGWQYNGGSAPGASNITASTGDYFQTGINEYGESVVTFSSRFTSTSPYITFDATDTGVFHLVGNYNNGAGFPFRISEVPNPNNLAIKHELGLAARLNDDGTGYEIISRADGTHGIDVVLEKGKKYIVEFTGPMSNNTNGDDYYFEPNTFKIYNRESIGSNIYAKTNINAGIISNDEAGDMLDPYTYSNSGVKVVEYDQSEINQAKLGMGMGMLSGDQVESGGPLEQILVDIILSLGGLGLSIAEKLLGVDGITIDRIVFNKIPQLVVDLRSFGGIHLPDSGAHVSTESVFSYEEVKDRIGTVYFALRNVAIVVYIVILLYIGIRIMMNVGGQNQSKYTKFIQYWITGLIFLFIVPYFFPLLPYISNVLVNYVDAKKTPISKYSVSEMCDILGIEYIGEDAEYAILANKLRERIAALDEELEETDAENAPTVEEARDHVQRQIATATAGLSESDRNIAQDELQKALDSAIDYVAENATGWDWVNQDNFEARLTNIQRIAFDNNVIYRKDSNYKGIRTNRLFSYEEDPMSPSESYRGPLYGVSGSAKEDISREYMAYLNSLTAENIPYNVRVNNSAKRVTDALKRNGITEGSEAYTRVVEDMQNFRQNALTYYNKGVYEKYKNLLTDYRRAATKELRDLYADMEQQLGASSYDPMVRLKVLAKEQSRVVYAIAWMILLLQTFKILILYFKRMIVIIILICLFPAIMAIYAIDKLGDGQSQSLQNWFKEFFANIIIQLFHALVYVVVVNIGIEMCMAAPDKNWFYLIIAVMALFPVETMLRSMLNLNSVTLGRLAFNIGSVLFGAAAAAKIFKGGFAASKNAIAHTRSTAETIKNNMDAEYRKKQREEKEKAEKKKKAEEKAKKDKQRALKEENDAYVMERGRDSYNKLRTGINDSRNSRVRLLYESARGGVVSAKHAIKEGAGKAVHAVGTSAYNVGRTIGDSKIGKATIKGVKTIGSKADSVANKAGLTAEKRAEMAKKMGQTAGAIGRGTKTTAKGAWKMAKGAYSVGKKVVGTTAGAVTAIETFGKTGNLSDAVRAGQRIGATLGDYASPQTTNERTDKLNENIEQQRQDREAFQQERRAREEASNQTHEDVSDNSLTTTQDISSNEPTPVEVQDTDNPSPTSGGTSARVEEDTRHSSSSHSDLTSDSDITITEEPADPRLEERVDKNGRRIDGERKP